MNLSAVIAIRRRFAIAIRPDEQICGHCDTQALCALALSDCYPSRLSNPFIREACNARRSTPALLFSMDCFATLAMTKDDEPIRGHCDTQALCDCYPSR